MADDRLGIDLEVQRAIDKAIRTAAAILRIEEATIRTAKAFPTLIQTTEKWLGTADKVNVTLQDGTKYLVDVEKSAEGAAGSFKVLTTATEAADQRFKALIDTQKKQQSERARLYQTMKKDEADQAKLIAQRAKEEQRAADQSIIAAQKRIQAKQREAAAIYAAMKADEAANKRQEQTAIAAEKRIASQLYAQEQAAKRTEDNLKRQEAATIRASKGVVNLTLSWQSFARLAAFQLLRRAVGELTQAIGESLGRASELTIRVAEIETISQKAQLATETWIQGLLNLSKSFGLDVLDQAEAAYQTISTQVAKGAEVFKFLAETNKFAITAVTTSTGAVNLLSGAIQAYRLSSEDANRVAATLFKTIELGRVRAQEMESSFGDIAVIANQLNIPLEELSAAIATLTVQGIKYNKAGTQLRGIFIKLLKPTKEMKNFLAELGYESGEAAIQALGLGRFLAILQERTKGSSTELAKFVSRIRGISGALALTGEGLDLYNKNLERIQKAQGDYDKAIDIALTAAGRRIKIFKESVNVFLTDVSKFWVEAGADAADYAIGQKKATDSFGTFITSIVSYEPTLMAYHKLLQLLGFDFEALAKQKALERILEQEKKIADKRIQNIQRIFAEEANKRKEVVRIYERANASVIANNRAFVAESIKDIKELEAAAKEASESISKFVTDSIKEQDKLIKQSERTINTQTAAIQKALTSIDIEAFQFSIGDLDLAGQYTEIQKRIQELSKRGAARIEAGDLLGFGDIKQAQKRQRELVALIEKINARRETLEKNYYKLVSKRTGLTDVEEKKLADVEAELKRINTVQSDNVTEQLKVIDLVEQEIKLRQKLVEQAEEAKKKAEEQRKELIANQATLEILAKQLTAFDLTKLIETRDINKIREGLQAQSDVVYETLKTAEKLGVNEKARAIIASRFETERKAAEKEISALQQKTVLENIRGAAKIQEEAFKALQERIISSAKLQESLIGELSSKVRRVEDDTSKAAISFKDTLKDVIRTGEVRGIDIKYVAGNFARAMREGNEDLAQTITETLVIFRKLEGLDLTNLKSKYNELVKAAGLTIPSADALLKATTTAKTAVDENKKLIENVEKAQQNFKTVVDNTTTSLRDMGAALKEINAIQLDIEKTRRARELFPPIELEAKGGSIRSHGQDRVPALLSPGEFVVNAKSTRKFFSQLLAINSGSMPHFDRGGPVTTNVGDINVSLQSSGKETVDVQRIGRALRREIRKGSIKL